MFGIKKVKEKVAVVNPVGIPTLPEVVQQYVSKNNDVLDNDFTNINCEIKKNEKIIDFLEGEKYKAYTNEKDVYGNKIKEFTKKNAKLILQKSIIDKQIEASKAGYQKIDLSFLSMKRKSKKGELSYHPAFSVHKYESQGKFIYCKIDFDDYYGEYFINIGDNYVSSFLVMKNLLKVFIANIDEKKFYTPRHRGMSYPIKKGFVKYSVRISTSFVGIIPEKTKEKIEKTGTIFAGCESSGIFLIKECPVWDEQRITKDPLIVGVIGNQAYLVDHFDTTDLEDYIKAEFTE